MGECIHQRPKGGLCGRKVKKGTDFCPYHYKKMNGMVRANQGKNLANLLGLSGDEAITYEQFLTSQKPHELHNELHQLRALLVAYRKAYNASNEEVKQAFLESVEEYCTSYLISEVGMSLEKASTIANHLLPPVSDAYDEFLQSMGVNGDYVKRVSSLIKDISAVAEKAVKIKDGMTINLVVKSEDFVDWLHEVVFVVVTDPKDRALLAQLTQIYLGKGSNKKETGEILEAEYEIAEEIKGNV